MGDIASRVVWPPTYGESMTDGDRKSDGISPKFWIGLAIVLAVAVFIALNPDETNESFGFFEAQTSLWIALTLAAAGGFVAGWLIGRRRN
jgi:lipopolysaccharide assembly protein A